MNITPLATSYSVVKSQIHEYNPAARKLQIFLERGCKAYKGKNIGHKFYATQATAKIAEGPSNGHDVGRRSNGREPFGQRAKERQANKDFFVDLLSSATTKRDAKAYITRLKSQPKPSLTTSADKVNSGSASSSTTNKSSLITRSRAVEDSPIFTQFSGQNESGFGEQETLHIALVKISNLDSMTDDLVNGIATTLSQLSRLSMTPCVVLEQDEVEQSSTWKAVITKQANRLLDAIEATSDNGGRIVGDLLRSSKDGYPEVHLRKFLVGPLQRGQIPIILPQAYSDSTQSIVGIGADQAMLALTEEFSALKRETNLTSESKAASLDDKSRRNISLDRVIVVDSTGAIPSTKSADEKHVFVNIEQEYASLQEELRSSTDQNVSPKHATNLRLLKNALRLLPASASGLITTPLDASNSHQSVQDESASRVGTRRQKNPLIHNILTDKPAYSSSLPTGRLTRSGTAATSFPVSTFVKLGMPLTILPDPDAQHWTANSQPRLKLTDPRINLSKLVYLIDDSFNRKLDVDAYLQRVNDRIAGVIIAGDYEGGAILTWETPPGAGSNDSSRQVPYLDKFAVLKRSQGAGGVADILFNAMVRSCFPTGVCWRSRKDNPVNKWYFERSRGTWKIPDMNWTMFWTTPNVDSFEGRQNLLDYEAVCRGVQPTWADNIKAQD